METISSPNSPHLRPTSKTLQPSAAWVSIVRGESETIPAQPSSPSPPSSSSVLVSVPASVSSSTPVTAGSPRKELMLDSSTTNPSSSPSETCAVENQPESFDNDSINVGKAKKPVWNKLSSNTDDLEASPVMGAISWPALSDSKASPKSSSDSLKGLSDGGSTSLPQEPVIASMPQKQINTNAKTPNHHQFARQKSKKGGGGGSAANGGKQQQPPPSPPPLVLEAHQNNLGKPGPVFPNQSPRDAPHKNHNWANTQSHTGNDHPHQSQRNFRRSNSGPHPRRDQDRGNHDWYPLNRSFNGRDVHMQPRSVPRNFIRTPPPPPPLNPAPFVTPPPLRPFGNPMPFPDMASPMYYVPAPPPESLRGVPLFHGPPFAMILPGAADPNLHAMLIQQIDYYFSPGNLCKDIFLRNHMDEQGWVPVSLIATFKRVKQLTTSIPLILDVMRNSAIVEVQGDKLRKRNDWMNWLRPPPIQSTSVPGSQYSSTPDQDMLASRIKSIRLDGGNTINGIILSPTDAHLNKVPDRSPSQEFNSRSQSSDSEGGPHYSS